MFLAREQNPLLWLQCVKIGLGPGNFFRGVAVVFLRLCLTQRYAHLADEALHRAAAVAGDIFSDVGKEQEPSKVIKFGGKKK